MYKINQDFKILKEYDSTILLYSDSDNKYVKISETEFKIINDVTNTRNIEEIYLKYAHITNSDVINQLIKTAITLGLVGNDLMEADVLQHTKGRSKFRFLFNGNFRLFNVFSFEWFYSTIARKIFMVSIVTILFCAIIAIAYSINNFNLIYFNKKIFSSLNHISKFQFIIITLLSGFFSSLIHEIGHLFFSNSLVAIKIKLDLESGSAYFLLGI